MDTVEIKHPFPIAADPVADGAPDKFPIDCFPPQIREVAEDMARVYQTPACLPAMSALAILSGAAGKWAEVHGAYKDRGTRLNLYVIAAAERGSGKGNTSQLAEPVRLREAVMQGEHRKRIAGHKADAGILRARIYKAEKSSGGGADLQDMHRRLAELEREARRHVALTLDNATSEAAIATLQDNGEELFCVSSEAGGAIKVALGRYTKGNASDFEWLLSAYSGDAMSVRRVNREAVTLESPCLSLLWMTQPSVLRELCANPETQERGLTARMLIFDSGARRQHDNGDNLAFTKGGQWKALVNRVLDMRATGKPVEIHCQPEAREVFRLFNNESVDYGREAFAGLDGELSRWAENAIKVAGLFALASGADTITPETANNACAVVKWCSFNYLAILAAGRRERKREELKRLLDIVRENGGEVTLRDLTRRNGITRVDITEILSAFPGAVEIERRITEGTQGGRPSEIITMPSAKPAKPAKPHLADSQDEGFAGNAGFGTMGGAETEGPGHA